MFKIRVVIVLLNGESVLLDSGKLPSFYLFKGDDLKSRVLSFIKTYVNYPDIWLDLILPEPELMDDELQLVYGSLVGKNNIKGEWENAGRIKERRIQEAVYNVSKMV